VSRSTCNYARQRAPPIKTRQSSVFWHRPAGAALLGFAYLVEGDWQRALAWALDPATPQGGSPEHVTQTVAYGLLRLGLAATGQAPDPTLAAALEGAPRAIREHEALLEGVQPDAPAGAVLDGAVKLYEQLVEGAIGGKKRESYAEAARRALMIRAIRRQQGREADFDRYYQELLSTYNRYPALKDELRTAVEGAEYKWKR
jgi:hypothetical protein